MRQGGITPVYRPGVGRVVLAMRRTGTRLVNRMPAVKRRMSEREQRFAGPLGYLSAVCRATRVKQRPSHLRA